MTIRELAIFLAQPLIKDDEVDALKDIMKGIEYENSKILKAAKTHQNPQVKSYIQANKKHNQIRQTYKQKIFNRTICK